MLTIKNRLNGAPFYFENLKDSYGRPKFVIYDDKSLFFFKSETKFRRAIVWFTCWPGFDNFIILMILINSLFLAAYDYGDRDNL